MTEIKYCVGVDIASSTFTAAVGEMPWKIFLKPQLFENSEDGYQTLIEWFRQHHLSAAETVVCMEATGVYSEGLAYFLYAKGYRVAVQSPLEVKRTFKPYGPKSDAVDSLQIAEYACRHTDKLSFWKPRSEILEQVKALLAVREQFVSQNVAHKNALQAIQRKVVRTPFAEQAYLHLIEQLKKQIQAIDTEVRRLIEELRFELQTNAERAAGESEKARVKVLDDYYKLEAQFIRAQVNVVKHLDHNGHYRVNVFPMDGQTRDQVAVFRVREMRIDGPFPDSLQEVTTHVKRLRTDIDLAIPKFTHPEIDMDALLARMRDAILIEYRKQSLLLKG